MKKYQKLLEIWFFKDFQGAEILGPNHLSRGTVNKITLLAKFSHLLQNQDLALKCKASDSEASLSNINVQIKV